MFCEVLLCSRKKEFYKREGKSNVKREAKKNGKEGREAKIWERDSGEYLSGIRSLDAIIFTAIFHILQIWMWT